MPKIKAERFSYLFSMYGTDGLIEEEDVVSVSEAILIIKNLIKNKQSGGGMVDAITWQ